MNDPEKRICPFCAEAIEVKAKLCPRCHQWLTLKSFRHPLVMMLIHIVPLTIVWVVFGLLIFSMTARLQNPRPFYSEFPGALKILESRMNWAQTDHGLRIYIAGVLTNNSPESWRSAEFDCRFFNANGVMIDADTRSGYTDVLAHDESAFRVSIIPTAPTNEYVSFKISVGNARNAKGIY
ncbi:MAG: FxLYD domain-containing protein [Verrucomicrobiia bacterium]